MRNEGTRRCNTRVVPIDSSANLIEAAQVMDKHDVRVLAVMSSEGEFTGMVSDRDLATAANTVDARSTQVLTVAPQEMAGCYDDVELAEAIQVMMLMRIRHLPVFDQRNQLIGFLSAQPRTHDIQ